ncbi:MAG: OsmC family protein [Gammaproteobacteria bacterium]|nr:OsmC family protein [Gammaproteobacteria bacterium]
MEISAMVSIPAPATSAKLRTDSVTQELTLPTISTGHGSSVSGGEILMLALATCYCNDLYRETGQLGIPLGGVEAAATARFEGAGLAASGIRYRALFSSPAEKSRITELLRHTDVVAEVHNTLRTGVPVDLIVV